MKIQIGSQLIYCVYRIQNTETKRVYFGSSKDPKKRWSRHLLQLKKGLHVNENLREDAKNFGVESFKFRVLSRHVSEHEMRTKEQLLLTMFWGRSSCYNREAFVEMDNGPDKGFILQAEHVSFR